MKRFWGVLAMGSAALGAALGGAQPLLADVKTGVDAWQQGDYAKAIGEWRPLAQGGDPDAQFNMGQAYKLGRGVKSDPATAIDWYRKAAAQGHARAEDNLGLLMFQQGERAGALPYLQRAAERGEPRAQYIVGTALFNGDLAPKNWVRAYALMTQASRSGLAQATTSLRQMEKYIPEAQRNEGLAEAGRMARAGQLASAEPQQSAPVTRDMPKPIRRAELPASSPAAKEAPKPQPKPQPAATPAPAKAAPAKTAPVKAAAAKPAPPRPASGPWRVQLGAFSAEARARTLWSQLSAKVGGLSAYQPYFTTSGGITRLQAGPFATSADAARLCGAIKAAGADCMPRKI